MARLARSAGGAIFAVVFFAVVARAAEQVRGLPFTRLYSFEETAGITGPSHLTFDRFGRLAAVQDGAYVVLNDSTWIDVAEKDPDAPRIVSTAQDADGTIYFGAFVTWGTLETTSSGKLRPRVMVPRDGPKWVQSTSFTEVLCTARGVYFAGWNGVVFWDRRSGMHAFFASDGVARIFSVGEDVFVSSHGAGVRRIDVERGVLEVTRFGTTVIENAVELRDGGLLVSTSNRRLLVFRGDQAGAWSGALGSELPGRVLCLRRLPDGHIALSVAGLGVFVLRESGEVLSSLTLPEYRRVVDLASHEPGVLWAAAETGIARILYGSPTTVFGQPLGLPVSWPQLVRWRDRLVIATAGRLYEPVAADRAESTRFQLVPGQPVAGTWAIAATERHLLVGNANGIHLREDGGRFVPILDGVDTARLAIVEGDVCFAIGPQQIAALRWEAGRWAECAPRIAGFGYPSVVHAARRSAWIELGANRVARLALRDGKIEARLFESFPWAEPRWIDVSAVGDTTVLTGGEKGRVFFDENSETLRDAPELRARLERSPHRILRLREGEDGVLWAAHEQGLFTLARDAQGPAAERYDLALERTPRIHLLPGGDVWLSTRDTLFRVERRADSTIRNHFVPRLTSVRDKRLGTELLRGDDPAAPLSRLHYAQNSLEFRFFAGGYATRRTPTYQARLDAEDWTQLGATSLLSVSDLREGRHQLDVRLVDGRGAPGEAASFGFAIAPPWHRTWYAFAAYGLAAALLVAAVVRLSIRRSERRNRELAGLVEKRTEELRATMQKLNDETRNSATLSERQRLAGEIHDSLQQGLSGLILQLDATLKLAELTPEVRSRLDVARSMVSFTRHEVQNAVWDMESPLLDRADLAAALQKLTELIGAGAAQVRIVVSGSPMPLSASVQHHLLRIAQEAITNAVRHGAADTIVITLDYGPTAVSLTIRDNGRGFEPHAVLDKGIGHFGLRSLRARATKIGAHPIIESTPGHGTLITVVVPRSAVASSADANGR